MSKPDATEKPDFNEMIKEFRKNKKAILLDVRSREEFDERHVDGSINIPVRSLDKAGSRFKDTATPFYVYCRSGIRSAMAAQILRRLGYSNVKDIGGILDYKDESL